MNETMAQPLGVDLTAVHEEHKTIAGDLVGEIAIARAGWKTERGRAMTYAQASEAKDARIAELEEECEILKQALMSSAFGDDSADSPEQRLEAVTAKYRASAASPEVEHAKAHARGYTLVLRGEGMIDVQAHHSGCALDLDHDGDCRVENAPPITEDDNGE